MNRATPATGWVRNPTMKSPDLDSHLASSYELGWTCNSKTGCLNRTPEGLCLGGMFPCYAYRLAKRLKQRYLQNLNIALPHEDPKEAFNDPFYPRFWPERLEQIRKLKKPSGIFLDDMSDWMGDYWPEEWTEAELQVMRDCPQHRFYTLTKQPQNLHKWEFPENCWVGVTATNADMFQMATGYLHVIEASVKYVSIEPLLSWNMGPNCMAGYLEERGINWLIIGAQTKPYKPPQSELIGEIVSAAGYAGSPIFLKDNLYMIKPKRQEMPI